MGDTNYIKGKRALVTGATSGIGEAIARKLANMGVHVIINGRDETKLQALKSAIEKESGVDVEIALFDVRDKESVNSSIVKLLDNLTIDILINNAGLALGLESIEEGDMEQWDQMIDTNIKGLLYVSKAVLPQMRRLESAHIINIGSVAGKTAYPGGNVYCATKAAVHSLSEAMNADLLGSAVKVGTIAPGAVETNFSKVRFEGDEQKASAVYDGYTPLYADDIAHAVVMMLNTPRHVNIQYLDIMPTAQRNPYLLDRSGKV